MKTSTEAAFRNGLVFPLLFNTGQNKFLITISSIGDKHHSAYIKYGQYLHMCKSNCQGTCLTLLKDREIASKEALLKVISVLDRVTNCNSFNDETGNQLNQLNSMEEIQSLKTEARRLLEELNHHAYPFSGVLATPGARMAAIPIFEEQSFKDRLSQLKKKIDALTGYL